MSVVHKCSLFAVRPWSWLHERVRPSESEEITPAWLHERSLEITPACSRRGANIFQR